MQNSLVKSFADFGVDQRIVDALTDAGITTPFPIQELTLPLALSGADLIGQARTGTGKTLAFGIPLLHRVDESNPRTQALVIVPTRELCLQVRDDLDAAGTRKGAAVVAAYGGRSIDVQADAIAAGAPIVVGTPGRLLDLLRRGILDLSGVSGLVLDEADEMLDLGFLPDVEQLIEACASQRQTLLFSATMPSPVVALARRYMTKPTFMRADADAGQTGVAPETEQYFLSCHRMDKPAVLARILQAPDRGLCVVFSRTKRMADVLAEELRGMGIKAAPIHSDLRQEARERALSKFRRGTIDVLVATEVAARGLDISDVTHVVNYDCPDDEKMYLHRIGRTGRAGAAGVAITLAVWNELARVEMIKRELGVTDPTHEVFSTSPILDELFDLPPRDAAPVVDRSRQDDVVDSDEEEGAAAGDSATESTRPRARRRRRGRRRSSRSSVVVDAPAVEDRPDDEEATEPQEPPGDDQRSSQSEVRVRRRTRTVRRVTSDESDNGAAGEREKGASKTPERSAGAREPRPSRDGGRGSARSGSGSARGGGSSTRGGGSPRGGTRSGAGRSGRRGQQGSRPPRRPRKSVDAQAARGSGKPSLARPFVIEHLP